MLSLAPFPRLLHRHPDVRGSLGSTGIAGKVVVFEGPFNPVLGHAVGIKVPEILRWDLWALDG
jgi:hypothetical protein